MMFYWYILTWDKNFVDSKLKCFVFLEYVNELFLNSTHNYIFCETNNSFFALINSQDL
jgi:tryptophan-rich sensory protein